MAIVVSSTASAAKIDVTASTYHIVDGDTFDAFPVGRIRLADINAPESGQPGYTEAGDRLAELVDGATVYLDVDDVDVDDVYHRLVCVVYVRYNDTHLLNVNKVLLDEGLAVEDDYSNEFDPSTWTTYIPLATPDLPTSWQDAHDLYIATLEEKAIAEAAGVSLSSQLNASRTENARLGAIINASVPPPAELEAQLAAARADLNASQAELAIASANQTALRAELDSSRAEQSSSHAQMSAAQSSASLAWILVVLAGAGAGAAAFVVGHGRGMRVAYSRVQEAQKRI